MMQFWSSQKSLLAISLTTNKFLSNHFDHREVRNTCDHRHFEYF